MLAVLELKDFAIVDELRLELAEGLNVFSGETGAGKSILIDALGLLIGGRADSNLIRSGAESALVQGIFTADAGSASAARRLAANGRSSARLGGELVTVGEMAEAGAGLIAIHGQHASQTLLSTAEQRKLLDRLLGASAQAELKRYRENFRNYQHILQEQESLEATLGERARRLDILSFQLEEIDAAEPKPGEEEALTEAAQSLRFAERIVQGAGQSLNLLSESEINALDLLAQALRHLESAGRYHKGLEALSTELSEALSGLQAISSELSSFMDFEAEPGRLEKIEARLALLDKLKLKYGGSIEAILAYRQAGAEEQSSLLSAESNLERLQSEREGLERTLNKQAERLSAARRKVANTLSQEVTGHLERLGMAKARFAVGLEPTALGPSGRDGVSFSFSANLGEPLAPLAAVASGGELSRLMLALNVVTGSDLPTLAFDEVDAGIGGQAARSVGALLKQLARAHQVLVVTHLPQVAAYADAQFFVEKLERAGRTVTRISRLDAAAREAELARMLSGSVTPTALAHARELLEEASLAVP